MHNTPYYAQRISNTYVERKNTPKRKGVIGVIGVPIRRLRAFQLADEGLCASKTMHAKTERKAKEEGLF